MREIRLCLWFLFGIFLVAVPMFAYASETEIAATVTPRVGQVYAWRANSFNKFGSVALDVCRSLVSNNCAAPANCYLTPSGSNYSCYNTGSYVDSIMANTSAVCINTDPGPSVTCTGNVYSCPPNQNWTLNGTLCQRPACVGAEIRDADGVCRIPACTHAANEQIGQWFTVNYPVVSGVTFCLQNCNVYAGPPRNRVGSTAEVQMFVNGVGGTASNCSYGGSEVTPNAHVEPTDLSPPPCPPGSGSYMSAGGVVMCTAATTPNATVPPVVTKKTETQNFPDGSGKTTTITMTCTGDGACSTTTVTNVTGATGGGAGQAGPIGTTTGTASKPSEQTVDFCAKNPSLQMCKGGMNEEATQKQVRDELRKLTTPDFADDSALKAAGTWVESQELKDVKDQARDLGIGAVDPIASQKGAFQQAMESGWFDPIPSSTCAPFTGAVGGRSFSFDFCPHAARISEWGGYGLWLMLVLTVFRTLTGVRQEGGA
jgi:hypothetical protein